MSQPPADVVPPVSSNSERDIVMTLFDLGRKVASVLDLDELLPRIPELIGRLVPFDAFAVYFVHARRGEISLGYAVGYPEESAGFTMPVSEGILGRVVETQQPIVVGDVSAMDGYVSVVPGMS